MTRTHNNNRDNRVQSLTKQSSLMSSGSRGSAPESVIIDTHSDSRVSNIIIIISSIIMIILTSVQVPPYVSYFCLHLKVRLDIFTIYFSCLSMNASNMFYYVERTTKQQRTSEVFLSPSYARERSAV